MGDEINVVVNDPLEFTYWLYDLMGRPVVTICARVVFPYDAGLHAGRGIAICSDADIRSHAFTKKTGAAWAKMRARIATVRSQHDEPIQSSSTLNILRSCVANPKNLVVLEAVDPGYLFAFKIQPLRASGPDLTRYELRALRDLYLKRKEWIDARTRRNARAVALALRSGAAR